MPRTPSPPTLPPRDLAALASTLQTELAGVKVERQVGVGEHAQELGLLVDRVAERLGREVAARCRRTRRADQRKKSSITGRR